MIELASTLDACIQRINRLENKETGGENEIMKILGVGSNGVLVCRKIIGPGSFGPDTIGAKLVPWEKFLTAGQKRRLARNQKYEQTVYAELRKRLQARP